MSDKLLNTAEAARFLRVSQASVRRWSDSGLIRARRVGRRRERRFIESDLVRFLGAGSPQPASGPPREVSVGGIPIPIYSHLPTFYNSDGGRMRLTIPFLRDGLRAGDRCFLEAAGGVLDLYLEALRKDEGVDLDGAIRDGSFVVSETPGGSVDRALAYWEDAFAKGIGEGRTLLRVVGEMASVRHMFESPSEMLKYEGAFNMTAKRFPNVTLCQYDVRAFDGATIYEVLRVHPDLYSLRLGSLLS
jgi:excisionase family DNA binding protein